MAGRSYASGLLLLAGVCAAFLPWGCASDSENEAEAHFNEGKALHEKDEWHAAIDCFTKAIALNPQFVEAYRHRGTLYLKMSQFDAAVSDYIEASKLVFCRC